MALLSRQKGRDITIKINGSSDDEPPGVRLACITGLLPEANDWLTKYVVGEKVSVEYLNSVVAVVKLSSTDFNVNRELVKRGFATYSLPTCRKKDIFQYVRAEYEYKLSKALSGAERLAILSAMTDLDELEKEFHAAASERP